MTHTSEMFQRAKAARENAYAPYSNYKVGACLRTKDGALFSGCNVENAAYGLTTCAEASAISQMVTEQQHSITDILIIGDGSSLISPCGACRQRIFEFATANTLVHLCNLQGIQQTITLAELLPMAFGPKQIEDSH